MPDPVSSAEHGRESLLSRISSEIVRVQREYYGKGPERAKSYMLDDFLMVVMRDSVTTSEITMLGFGYQLANDGQQSFADERTNRRPNVPLLIG